mmetsp:Transcript_22176/g.74888  ORF Transcript_22176/g.74888 Transcript_22176/m.74888 type:complete len:282 (+) Transcript_22176:509-1354(+)
MRAAWRQWRRGAALRWRERRRARGRSPLRLRRATAAWPLIPSGYERSAAAAAAVAARARPSLAVAALRLGQWRSGVAWRRRSLRRASSQAVADHRARGTPVPPRFRRGGARSPTTARSKATAGRPASASLRGRRRGGGTRRRRRVRACVCTSPAATPAGTKASALDTTAAFERSGTWTERVTSSAPSTRRWRRRWRTRGRRRERREGQSGPRRRQGRRRTRRRRGWRWSRRRRRTRRAQQAGGRERRRRRRRLAQRTALPPRRNRRRRLRRTGRLHLLRRS